MMPRILAVAALLATTACPATPPPAGPAAADATVVPSADATWTIVGHVLTPTATVDEHDALAWNGRTITITKTSYASPFQGTCETAGRVRRNRALEEVLAEASASSAVAASYALKEPIVEYRLTCREHERPPLAIYVGAERALTCFGGVCYVLRR